MPSIRRPSLLIGLAVILAAVGGFFAVRAMTGNAADVAAPNPSEAAPSSPSPAATPRPEPFEVKVVKARSESIQSSTLFGRKASDNPAAVADAADAAAAALERYLTAQFVNADSRFTTEAVRALLTQEAFRGLRDAERTALGVASLEVAGASKGRATARATVLHDGEAAHAVTLQYRATIRFVAADMPQPLIQEGTMVFAKGPDGWRADMADVRLSLPNAPKRDRPNPPPRREPAEEASP